MDFNQGVPLVYHWPFAKVVYLYLPALLLFPFLLLKPNRRPGAWAALIPFALIVALASASLQIPRSPLANAFISGFPYIVMLASTLCMLSLVIYAVPAWSRRTRLLALPALSVLPGAVVLFFSQGEGKLQNWFIPSVYALAPLILLASLVLAGKRCRKHWGIGRFSLLVLAWSFLFVLGVMVIPFAYLVMTQPAAATQWRALLAPTVLSLLVVAALLFTIALAFILTAFLNRLYRERLMAAFGVNPSPEPGQSAAGSVPVSPGQVS